MKPLLIFCILFLSVTNVFAQLELFDKSFIQSFISDTISKKIVDNAYLRVYYSLKYRPNPKSDVVIRAQTFLQVGKNTTRFMDYNHFRADSIKDNRLKNGEKFISLMNPYTNALEKVEFEPLIISGYPEGKAKFQQAVESSFQIYEYEEDIPEIKWTLTKADTIIKKYKCKKALGEYRGRKYIAWYTEQIDLPLGPYIFRGLPGLIIDIRDTRSHYVFKLSGIQKIKKKDPIYLTPPSKVIRTTRAKVRKMNLNYHNNPVKVIITALKNIIVSEKLLEGIEGMEGAEDLADIKPLPYNPIELE